MSTTWHPWHGYVDSLLARLLGPYAVRAGLIETSAFNLGEPDDFRVPDRGYHRTLPSELFVPTAAIVVEVVSPHDETWEKFGFYAHRGVQEICTAEPLERRLRWWQLEGDAYTEVATSGLLGITVEDLAAQIDWPVTRS